MATKALIWVAVAFAAFYLLSSPGDAAGAVRAAGGGLVEAGDAVTTFFETLFA